MDGWTDRYGWIDIHIDREIDPEEYHKREEDGCRGVTRETKIKIRRKRGGSRDSKRRNREGKQNNCVHVEEEERERRGGGGRRQRQRMKCR